MPIVHSAQHVGRRHILTGTNCQDALGTLVKPGLIAGVICDGCSEGKHSEVGAKLAVHWLLDCLTGGDLPPLWWMWSHLQDKIKNTLSGGYQNETNFIKNYMLFTVMGFIITPHLTTLFNAGDGVAVVNDDVQQLNVGDEPYYPAYNLLRDVLPSGYALQRWFWRETHPTSEVKRIAIGSDAWKNEEGLLSQVWDFEHPNGLQRYINRWSDRDHRFSDDVSIITVEGINESLDW